MTPLLCGLTLMHPPAPRSVPMGPAVGPGLQHRDPYALTQQATSEHFALRWGSELSVSDDERDAVLAILEAAWDQGVDTLGMQPPTGSATHFVNVYLGESGDDAPPIGFVGGYVVPDLDGAEMMVLHPDLLLGVGGDEHPLQGIVTHEFFHVLQFASGALAGGAGPFAATHQVWFWESTASWFAHEALPGNSYVPSVFGAYGLFPWLPVDHYDPGATDLTGGRIYHSALLHRYLTEHVADATLMVDAWSTADDGIDPLALLEAGLLARGTTLDAQFPAFATHNAVLDYADGERYDAWAEYWVYDGAPDGRVYQHLQPSDLPATIELPAEVAPHAYGYQVIAIDDLGDEELLIVLDGEATGTLGSTSAFHVAWVGRSSGVPTHGVLGGPVVDDGWVLDVTGFDDLHLVLTAQVPGAPQEEAFAASLILDIMPPPTLTVPSPTGDTGRAPTADTGATTTPITTDTATPPTGGPHTEDPAPTPDEGCGCQAAPGHSLQLLLPITLLLGRRRRTAPPTSVG